MERILELIDAEIAQLQSARRVLAEARTPEPTETAPKRTYKKRKRKLSPEGRAKIVAALKARWAAKKK